MFEGLKEEAETHSTRVIWGENGVGLRNNEINTVELPSSLSKQQIYYCYCFCNGNAVKSNAKGHMPSIKTI